jgi:hypothetical protein
MTGMWLCLASRCCGDKPKHFVEERLNFDKYHHSAIAIEVSGTEYFIPRVLHIMMGVN